MYPRWAFKCVSQYQQCRRIFTYCVISHLRRTGKLSTGCKGRPFVLSCFHLTEVCQENHQIYQESTEKTNEIQIPEEKGLAEDECSGKVNSNENSKSNDSSFKSFSDRREFGEKSVAKKYLRKDNGRINSTGKSYPERKDSHGKPFVEATNFGENHNRLKTQHFQGERKEGYDHIVRSHRNERYDHDDYSKIRSSHKPRRNEVFVKGKQTSDRKYRGLRKEFSNENSTVLTRKLSGGHKRNIYNNHENIKQKHSIRPKTGKSANDCDKGSDEMSFFLENVKVERQDQNVVINWSDTFGNLTEEDLQEGSFEKMVNKKMIVKDVTLKDIDDGDGDEMEINLRGLRTTYYKLPPEWYTEQMIQYGKKGMTQKAVDVLEVILLKNDRLRPIPKHFYTLINIVGKSGDTRKAFHLYKRMRQFEVDPIPNVFHNLFVACSKSIYGREDGLYRARRLIEYMKMKDIQPSWKTMNTMIKCFGIHGETEIAFFLADQSVRNFKPTEEFYLVLLNAAASNTERGLALAIGVWRKMILKGIKPDAFHYSLLLRIVRFCQLGNQNNFHEMMIETSHQKKLQLQFLQQTSEKDLTCRKQNELQERTERIDTKKTIDVENSNFLSTETTEEAEVNLQPSTGDLIKLDEDVSEVDHEFQISNEPDKQSSYLNPNFYNGKQENFPDILHPQEILSDVLSLDDLDTKQKRIDLLGGVTGFLVRMDNDKVPLTPAVAGQLLDVTPNTYEAEMEFLQILKSREVRPDIDMITYLMFRRICRGESKSLKELETIMYEENLTPNIHVYKYLSYLNCKTAKQLREFVDDIMANGIQPTMGFFLHFMKDTSINVLEKSKVLRIMHDLDIYPTKHFIETMEQVIEGYRKFILKMEQQKNPKGMSAEEVQRVSKQFTSFMKHYKDWLNVMPLAEESV